MNKKLIIAIDGTAGSGKSTLASVLAKRLKYVYLDTGAMYRAIAYRTIKMKVDKRDTRKLVELARNADISVKRTGKVFVDGRDVTKKIRLPEVSGIVSCVSAVKGVRREMVKLQRRLGRHGGIVAEGRDIGTVVFPKADIKFFLVAELKERVKRRNRELVRDGIKSKPAEVEENIINRDMQDSSRKVSPLKPARDAIIIDTTTLTMKKKNDLVWRYIIQKL